VRPDAPDELLDEYRLDGVVAMQRLLMPKRNALLVDETSLDDAVDAIGEACQRWGGAAYLLVPSAQDAKELPDGYRVLEDALIDEVWTREVTEDLSFRGTDRRVVSWSVDHFLLATLYWSRYERDDWGTVCAALPTADDPWFVAYLAALGHLPERPRTRLLEMHDFFTDLDWDRMFPFERKTVTDPGPEDLLSRLREPASRSPASMSMALLRIAHAGRAADIPSPAVLPPDGELSAELGPNLVVVYEPRSVSDLCAIWNLRAANGLARGLPLGVPDGDEVPAALDSWTEEFAQTMWGLRETRMALVSTSVSRERLEEFAAAARYPWEVVDLTDVLRVADRPGRLSSELVTFDQGLTQVPAWDPEDRSELARYTGRFHQPKATIRFCRRDRRLPRLKTLDHDYTFEPSYSGGGFELPGGRHERLLPVRWPAGWTVLEAMARELGVRIAPSESGRAATAFLRHVRSWAGLEILMSREVVDMLYRLGERAGMTWFRRKVADIGRSVAGADEAGLDRLERKLDELSVGPTDHDQHTVTFSGLVTLLGREAAVAWLAWAERAGIVVRGVNVTCEHCTARGWRPMGDLAPPVICRGCGRSMHHPFGPAQLTFRYRGAETLLRVLEHDALVHLLAMRFLARLFEERLDRPSTVYGMYPGVDFHDPDGGHRIGEADVVVVMHDGSLVIGECKRHGAGLNTDEVDKLERLAQRLGSPWTFLATTDAAADCPQIWPDSQRALPETPRFCVSAEQLFEPDVVWTLGTNPLEWTVLDPEAQADRETSYRRQLPDAVTWLSGARRVDEQLIAERDARSEASGGLLE
jgi:hypothetical protein